MVTFFNFSPTSNHIHPLQVDNCGSNSRLVVDEDDNGKFRLERVNSYPLQRGDRLWSSDVTSILTSIDVRFSRLKTIPTLKRVKLFLLAVDP